MRRHKTFVLQVKDNGEAVLYSNLMSCEFEADKIEEFNHYGNGCVVLQKECEKFVAERRMEAGIETKKELDDAQGDT